jgi:heat shock protein HslJ
MKRYLHLVLLLGLLFSTGAFKKKDTGKNALSGTWLWSSLPGADISRYPSMSLTLVTQGHKMNAVAVCNRMEGSYSLDVKAGKLSFQSVKMTWKACPDIKTEKQLLDVLGKVTHYKNDVNTLQLFHDNQLLAILVRPR